MLKWGRFEGAQILAKYIQDTSKASKKLNLRIVFPEALSKMTGTSIMHQKQTNIKESCWNIRGQRGQMKENRKIMHKLNKYLYLSSL